jgi:hypothetical protein
MWLLLVEMLMAMYPIKKEEFCCIANSLSESPMFHEQLAQEFVNIY